MASEEECGLHTCFSANTMSVSVEQCSVRCEYVPAFVHSPQVNTGEGGATLVPFAGVRRAPQGDALHADLGNPITRLAVQGHVAAVEAYISHAACG